MEHFSCQTSKELINKILGTDTETDAAFLKRFLSFVQTPAASGNAAHYIEWVKQVPGIEAVQVFPLWNGAGTIKVYAIDANSQLLNNDLLSSLQKII